MAQRKRIGIRRLGFVIFAIAAASVTVALFTRDIAAQTPPPYVAATRIGTAALITPSAADTFYGSSTTSTNGLGLSDRPDEIRELARALRNDPDLIYDFVRNNIEIEWAYGLRKGALGALVDHSGTAFDQAKLMIDLLREAGFTASYNAGTIALSGSQFYDWSGITSATAACQLLSSGAIPAIINGSTTSDCNYGSATVSTVTLSHIWVSATIGGTAYLFDPSYKPHAFIAGVNLNTATGLTSGAALSNASSGMSTGTAGSGGVVSYVRNLNAESLNSTLQTYGANLLTYINSNVPAGAVEDVVGGQHIVRFETPTGGLRQTSLPYTASILRSWSGDIPNQYRTTLTVQIAKAMDDDSHPTIIDRLLYVDEIYGRKLVVEPSYAAHANVAGDTNTYTLKLTKDDGTIIGSNLAQYSVTEQFVTRDGTVTLVANHPYASAANGSTSTTGDYMDQSVAKPVYMLLPFVIVNAWGDANAGLIDTWGQRNDTSLPRAHPPCDECGILPGYPQSKGDARREQLTASWMVQASQGARLHAAIGRGVFTLHHSLGVIVADAQIRIIDVYPHFPGTPATYYFNVVDSFDRIDVDDTYSYVSKSATVADRRAAVLAIAATRDALEASVPGQIADLPDTTSTATRFEWGNRPPSGEDPSSYGQRRFYQFNAANETQALPLALVEGQTSNSNSDSHPCGGEPVISSGEVGVRRGALASAITAYADAGFDIVSSEEAFLGPGQRGGAYTPTFVGSSVCAHNYSFQRGGALVAVRYADGDPVEIAHLVVGAHVNAKGGGGGAQTTNTSQYDPSTAADILKSRFVDRANAVGVDLRGGSVTYASPAELSVGNGDFPYRLSANLIWRGGLEANPRLGPQMHSQPQTPWTSNWHNTLNVSASGLEAMGQTDARAAAGTIAAFLTQQDIYRASPSTQRDVAGVLVSAWWLKQIAGNVVTATVGTDSRQFIRNVSGDWFAPGASEYATLSQSGARTAGVQQAACSTDPGAYSPTRGWLYNDVSFQLTGSGGDVRTFANWKVETEEPDCSIIRGFRLSSWTFPRGVTVNLTYTQLDTLSSPVLTDVTNTLGRHIHFNYTGAGSTLAWSGYDNALTSGDARAVTFCTGLTCVNDPASAQTRFALASIAGERRLTEVYDADDTTTPSLRYTYDTLGRVKEARDAEALQGSRSPYLFRIAPGVRGEREDPAGGRYAVLANIYDSASARWQRFVDEIGRPTYSRFDGRGRVDRTVYPEFDEERLTYDARNRVTELRRVAKPSTGLSDIVIGATWNDTWNKPATITDARGYRTDFAYVASGNGAGELSTATRPAPTGSAPIGSGTRPVYTFTYGAFGRVATTTDPTGLVTSNSINGTTGNLTSTALDPSGVNAITSFTYDAQGDTLTASDPRGNVTESTYDVMRRPRTMLHHNGNVSAALLAAERTNYNLLGQVTSTEGGTAFTGTTVTSWLTRETRTYTHTGQVATLKDALNDTTANVYDGLDRVFSVTDPVGRVTRFTYDLAGQQTVETRAYGTALEQAYATYTYTPNGQRASVKDANNNLSSYVYDGFDRLSELHFPSATLGAETASATDYEGYGYDANSNRISLRVRSSESIGFSYDNLNRQTLKDTPGGTSADVYFDYDLAGRTNYAHFVSSGGSGVDYAYDTAGRLTSETSYGRALAFQYDSTSSRTRITWPDSNYAQYHYDALNRVDAIGENGATSGAGVLATYTYDPLSRRVTLRRRDDSTATFTYDDASRLTQLEQTVSGTGNNQTLGFTFTAASQIAQRTLSNGAYSWATPAASRSYSRNGLNQYAAVGGVSFSYDGRGNFTSDGTRTFAYDLENHLTSVSTGSTSLGYDPLGRLHSYTTSGATTEFLYDGDRLSAEFNAGGTLLRRYVHGPGVDEPLARYEGSGLSDRRYLITDNQGSVIAEDGASVVRYTYGPYGEPNTWTGSRFRYTGQIALPEVALYHYKGRVYDPVLGRFLQTDPVGYGQGPNLYSYVLDDPINNVDPTGAVCLTLGGTVYCDHPDQSVPFVRFPAPAYWPSTIGEENPNYHNYNHPFALSRTGGALTQRLAQQAGILNPTPGAHDAPASTAGTLNDVGYIALQTRNMVKSYIMTYVDNNDRLQLAIVNVTMPGHELFPGYIVQYFSQEGGAVTYHVAGEGVGFTQQGLNIAARIAERVVWGSQANQFRKYIGQRSSCPSAQVLGPSASCGAGIDIWN